MGLQVRDCDIWEGARGCLEQCPEQAAAQTNLSGRYDHSECGEEDVGKPGLPLVPLPFVKPTQKAPHLQQP